jgi:non-canonical (house-cleaning) NTP pyrophosphatase
MNDIESALSVIRGTETVVPPPKEPEIPPFESHKYPISGRAVLLVVPTSNKSKQSLLLDTFRSKAPEGVELYSLTLPVDSEVGEQPYNEAGSFGAYNRITNALRALHSDKHDKFLRRNSIGTIIVASIESYIQTNQVPRPVDFGFIVIHNATTGLTRACLSKGTTVDPKYVERARRFGYDRHPNYGRATVGRILAAQFPGLDPGDWQTVLSGHSRYDALKEAVSALELPLGTESRSSHIV